MKRTIQVSIILLALVLLLVATVLLQQVNPAQRAPDFEVHSFADTLSSRDYDLDSLRKIIGTNKVLPAGFEVAAAIACTAYPELKDLNIEMILLPEGAPMESTVKVWSLFGSRRNRHYQILLNDAPDSYFEPILLRSLPFDGQVGILAHELGHVAYYHQLNIFQFGKWGLRYLQDDEFRATHERTTDLMPIYHGLGSQIYQYAYFIRKDTTCIEFYENAKGLIDKYYMTDVELSEAMKRITSN
jgi:hypothetical protein